MQHSRYQKAIFAFTKGLTNYSEGNGELAWDTPIEEAFQIDFNGKRNAVVEAVAGSGKTTTIVESLKYVTVSNDDAFDQLTSPKVPKVLFVAFNKHIAEELQRRVPKYVQASTLNSIGWQICRANEPRVQLDKIKDENILRTFLSTDFEDQRKLFYKVKGSVCKMVGLFKALLITEYEDVFNQFDEIADKYDVNMPEVEDPDFDFQWLVHAVWEKSVSVSKFMNFDDQIYFPVAKKWPMPTFDWVFGDEAQDWSPVQIELVKVLGRNGRIVAVGDRHQSIYGFRGADPDAIPNIISSLDAVVLPLSICYRCPDAVIAKAREIVPHIENPENNPKGDGVVDWVTTADFKKRVKDGDFVLCRTTAPLVKRCLEFIGQGRKASVKGRDLGQGLCVLLEQLAPSPSTSAGELIQTLFQYRAEQLMKLEKAGREAEMLAVEDRCDTLEALAMGCNTTLDIKRRIDTIFSDANSEGITLCTGHRSKGLEAERIWLLRPDLCPHPKSKKEWQKIQEDNLLYVMITRSMSELYFVLKEQGEK